jgi:hypothetical protein
MGISRKKTIMIPEEPVEPKPLEPLFAFVGDDKDERDTSKPVGYDDHGNPLYAPRGLIWRWP